MSQSVICSGRDEINHAEIGGSFGLMVLRMWLVASQAGPDMGFT